MNLLDLKENENGRIVSIGSDTATRQHFLDMGLIPGVNIQMIKYAPLGDPIEYRLHGYELTLRKADAETIIIEKSNVNKEEAGFRISNKEKEHPGLGEYGKYHDRSSEDPLAEDELLTFALVGNQNCGKTTLFNQLTGASQHVGNFPGVTVDRKDGQLKKYKNTMVTDLPGIYSLSPYTSEELVTRDFILNEKPKGIINILDANSIERGLYLTMQLLELNIPMVLAINMMDELESNGGYVDINELEKRLGIPVIPISALKNQGVKELVEHAVHVARYQERPLVQDFCLDDENGGAVHRCLHSIMYLIEDHARDHCLPLRFTAGKCAEGDELIIEKLGLDQNEKETLEHIARQMEEERHLDRKAAIADMRYSFILKTVAETFVKPRLSKEHLFSMKADKLLTGKYTAIPAFILIIGLIFFLTFGLIGPFFEKILAFLITELKNVIDLLLSRGNVNESLHSLIIDGIFEGIGSILSFLPIIIILFFFLSLLEDSGYMARVAFVMDKLLRKIGLSGRSIVPMLVGFGCTVPGVMAARTLPSERDRKMTILLTPFMSCSAKLPIYVFFAKTFFPQSSGLLVLILYVLGIGVGLLYAFLYKTFIFKGEAVPFVMELPNYRLPSFKNVGQLLWEKAKDFLERAFTVIFLATIVIWFLEHFSFGFRFLSTADDSILAVLSGFFTPLFKPCGFADWRIIVALISGFLAKESVVSSINVLFAEGELLSILAPKNALALLVFALFYTPCIAAIAAIKKELGWHYAAYVVISNCLLAWLLSAFTYGLALLF